MQRRGVSVLQLHDLVEIFDNTRERSDRYRGMGNEPVGARHLIVEEDRRDIEVVPDLICENQSIQIPHKYPNKKELTGANNCPYTGLAYIDLPKRTRRRARIMGRAASP